MGVSPAAGKDFSPNRLVVVNEEGRVYDRTGLVIQAAYQDDGMTLKIFVQDLPQDKRSTAQAQHFAALKASMEHDQLEWGKLLGRGDD